MNINSYINFKILEVSIVMSGILILKFD